MTDVSKTTKPGWLERLLYQPVRLLRWLRLADYDEAREQATRDIVQRISRND